MWEGWDWEERRDRCSEWDPLLAGLCHPRTRFLEAPS
uniref:Uncharacterized protein n=1 Tax=Trichinella nativa TaxID=6335 RepID=A0A0V1KJB5_9BILA